MTYDKENCLASYLKQSGPLAPPTMRYVYDADGLRRAQGTALPLTTLVWVGKSYLGEV